ncbi:MAG: hypothetical protein Q9190_002606 [Brigantiaea leucoxantha]
MESISRISSMLETARELTLEAAQSAGASRSFNLRPTRDLPFLQVKKLLDSRNDREILEGLRKVISMMYRSKPCLPYFSSVVKNIASPNIEIKKLVYIYVLHYAESEPDLALLSINTIQKSLTDQNPQVRAMALRVMSGIRVPVISQIVSLAIKRGCVDMSPHVRKAAALAIPKCYRLDPSTLPQLLEYLSSLLGDKQYYVVGSAVTAFLEICPDRIDLIHKHYRALVRKLVDMDEWGQLATLRLMSVYARRCFPKKMRKANKAKTRFYQDEASGDEDPSGEEIQILDRDLELFLKACKSLLQSRNSAVIVSATRCFLELGTPNDIDSAIGPLVALLRSPHDIQQIVLYNIVAVCLVRPEKFLKYVGHFILSAADPFEVSRLKLEILTLIFPYAEPHVREMILAELEHFTRASNPELVRETVRAIGRCAQNDTGASNRCLRLLLDQVSSQNGNLVAESLTVIRHLIQQNPQAHMRTVIHLAKNLDTTINPEARATIIWLVGEFSGVSDKENIAPDVLRILAKGFADESEAAKMQIVLLAAKVYLHHLLRTEPQPTSTREEIVSQPISIRITNDSSASDGFEEHNPFASVSPQAEEQEPDPNPNPEPGSQPPDSNPEHPIPLLWSYILLLSHYDTSYDLRDQTRIYRALLSNPSSTQLASLVLLAPKPVPHTPSPSEHRQDLPLGSSSLVLGTKAGDMGNKMELPEWVKEGEEPDARVRDDEVATECIERRGKEVTGGGIRPAGEILDEAVRREKKVVVVEESGKGKGKGKEKSLEDWLGEKEEEGNNAEEESTETETESETGSGSEYEEMTDEESGGEGERERLVR